MTRWTISILTLTLVSCGSIKPTLPPLTSYRKPTPSAKVFKPTGEWKITSVSSLDPLLKKTNAMVTKKGSVYEVDLKGSIIDGSLQKGNGDQSEDQTPLWRAYIPLKVKNGFIKNNKNAATFYEPGSSVEQITWLNVGEDAVATHDGAYGFIVKDCEFINSSKGDKSIQLNEARDAQIIDNLIYGGITGARVGKIEYSSKTDKAYCSNNTFIGVDTAFNVGKIALEVRKPNTYKSVRLPFKVAANAKIINPDGKVEAQ